MGKKDEIDWDDEEAVAAARGDTPDDGKTDEERSLYQTDEEKAAAAAKAEEDAKAEKAEAEKEDADKGKAAKSDGDAAKESGKDKDKATDELMVPKSRMDTKTAQNDELRARIAKYEAAEVAAASAKDTDDVRTAIEKELGDMDAAVNKAIADDDMDEATRLRGDIREKEREMWQLDMSESSAATADETREQVRLDLTIDHIESTYDEFNPETEGYSQETVDKVQELRVGFFATGKYTPTQSLLRAMDYVLPKKDMASVEDAGAKADVEAERKKSGLKKATDAANRQPPDASKVGDDSDAHGLQGEIDVDKLTYEDIEALPEATLKRLRGDTAA